MRLRRHALLIHAGEIDRIEHQRRETAVAGRIAEDLAREREQHARAFDEHRRMQHILREILEMENTGIEYFGGEDDLGRLSCRGYGVG